MDSPNAMLAAWMKQFDVTQVELVEALNDRIRAAGGRGTVTDRTVRYWLAGKTRWPHAAQRRALEEVFDCSIHDLGFIKPVRGTPDPSEDIDPVHRRNFLASATAAITTPVVPAFARPSSVGFGDIQRLRAGLDELVSLDDQRGGHAALEQAAVVGARRALSLNQAAATERTHQRLYAIAAHYTAMAAWSCIDGRDLDRAQAHLNHGGVLAGLSNDPQAQMRIWNFLAMLSHHQGRASDAVAAAQAAQRTRASTEDPLHSSLAHARIAIGHSDRNDRQAALRSLGYAEEALARVEPDRPRPGWIHFYGRSELISLSAIVRSQLGDHAEAEALSHQSLALTPPAFRRNRAQATARLALAQLHQGGVDISVASAHRVLDLMGGDPLPGRMRTLLGDYHRELLSLAPDVPATREWAERARHEWSRRP